jgi:arylsulfatase A-like enzyme
VLFGKSKFKEMQKTAGQDITRRHFLKCSAVGAVGALVAVNFFSCRNLADNRPNFVFFLTDDQRWDGMSCAGNSILETPNIDRIAREGVRFSNMFVTNSLCGPSRASYLTGLYSHTHGVRRNGMALSLKHKTFPEILKDAGYETAFIGKWHNIDLGRDRGFDYFFGFKGQGRYRNPVISENYGPEKEYKGHVTDILTDKAVAFLKKEHCSPFCLLLWFKASHRSFQPAERFKDLYADDAIAEPVNFWDDYRTRPDAIKTANMKIGDFADIPDFQTFVKDYYRCLVGVDENVGRVLDTLDEQGLKADTAVVYAGDNGFFIGEHHFFDKRFMYEESIRVPLLIRFPKTIRRGAVNPEIALNVDIAPTFLEMAGISIADGMDGRSLVPILEGDKLDWRKDFLYEYYEYPGAHSGRMNRGVRTERWKYIHYFQEPQEFELYDLQNDPHEMNNLIHDPGYRDAVETLRRRMDKLREETHDPDL